MTDYEEEMHWQMNPMESLIRQCEAEKEMGGCNNKAVYQAMDIRAAEEADDRGDEVWESEAEQAFAQIENECERSMSELILSAHEYRDSYAANEWGDQLWEANIDPWDEEAEICARDMEIDAAMEQQAMCEAADREEAFIKAQKKGCS
jgi:hypothetical protein